jgi:hypothetical protein
LEHSKTKRKKGRRPCDWQRDAPLYEIRASITKKKEKPMPIYRVTLKEPAWPHDPLLLRAPLARVAQRYALVCLQDYLPKSPEGTTPWRSEDLTLCVQVHGSGYPESGPTEILEPIEYRDWYERA